MRRSSPSYSHSVTTQFAFNYDYWTEKGFVSGTGVSEYQTAERSWYKATDLVNAFTFIDGSTYETTSFAYVSVGIEIAGRQGVNIRRLENRARHQKAAREVTLIGPII